MVVAPATANTLSKMANGDNLLIATLFIRKMPSILAPAMDLDMYIHPSTITFNAQKSLKYYDSC
jgi:phosphopantothenoylcysteine decarboxylase/phosphopantothenate--cysteine ligase